MKRLALAGIIGISISFGTWAKGKDHTLNPAQRNGEKIINEYKMLLETEKNNVDIYKNVVPAVVNVSNIQTARSFWDFDPVNVPRGSGTGFVWNEHGYIVTNYHVIHGGDKFIISFHGDKTQYDAELVGSEPRKDIAVLKLKQMPKNLKPILVGSSRDLMVGQKTIAIGNPFGFDHTMTVGTVSALGRKIQGIAEHTIHNMIQTDASINPGNSGGPLMDSRGRVIGMNTMIVSRSGSSAGLGFAVPIDTIKSIVPQLVEHGRVIRPWLGIYVMEQDTAAYFGIKKGLVVKAVEPNGPADKAKIKGIQKDRRGRMYFGDIILKVSGEEVNNLDEIGHVLDKHKAGEIIDVVVERENKKKTVKLKLEESKF